MTADGPPGSATVEAVVVAVRDGIMQGRYVPGQRLPEADLVSLYRASRGAVRSALAQLENEGIVEREHNRGARVRPISLEEAVEITEARAVLEGLCAAKAAERATADDRARLRVLGAQLTVAVESSDIMTYTRVNQLVHHAVHPPRPPRGPRHRRPHHRRHPARPAPHAERALPLHRRAPAGPPGRGAARAPRGDRDRLLGRSGPRPADHARPPAQRRQRV